MVILKKSGWKTRWLVPPDGAGVLAAASVATGERRPARCWRSRSAPGLPPRPGDGVKITVFQNPDLSLETRGCRKPVRSAIRWSAACAGRTQRGGGRKGHCRQPEEGRFVLQPQVTVVLQQVRGARVAVLRQVAGPVATRSKAPR